MRSQLLLKLNHKMIHSRLPGLPLTDELGLEGGVTITGYGDLYFTMITFDK